MEIHLSSYLLCPLAASGLSKKIFTHFLNLTEPKACVSTASSSHSYSNEDQHFPQLKQNQIRCGVFSYFV